MLIREKSLVISMTWDEKSFIDLLANGYGVHSSMIVSLFFVIIRKLTQNWSQFIYGLPGPELTVKSASFAEHFEWFTSTQARLLRLREKQKFPLESYSYLILN